MGRGKSSFAVLSGKPDMQIGIVGPTGVGSVYYAPGTFDRIASYFGEVAPDADAIVMSGLVAQVPSEHTQRLTARALENGVDVVDDIPAEFASELDGFSHYLGVPKNGDEGKARAPKKSDLISVYYALDPNDFRNIYEIANRKFNQLKQIQATEKEKRARLEKGKEACIAISGALQMQTEVAEELKALLASDAEKYAPELAEIESRARHAGRALENYRERTENITRAIAEIKKKLKNSPAGKAEALGEQIDAATKKIKKSKAEIAKQQARLEKLKGTQAEGLADALTTYTSISETIDAITAEEARAVKSLSSADKKLEELTDSMTGFKQAIEYFTKRARALPSVQQDVDDESVLHYAKLLEDMLGIKIKLVTSAETVKIGGKRVNLAGRRASALSSQTATSGDLAASVNYARVKLQEGTPQADIYVTVAPGTSNLAITTDMKTSEREPIYHFKAPKAMKKDGIKKASRNLVRSLETDAASGRFPYTDGVSVLEGYRDGSILVRYASLESLEGKKPTFGKAVRVLNITDTHLNSSTPLGIDTPETLLDAVEKFTLKYCEDARKAGDVVILNVGGDMAQWGHYDTAPTEGWRATAAEKKKLGKAYRSEAVTKEDVLDSLAKLDGALGEKNMTVQEANIQARFGRLMNAVLQNPNVTVFIAGGNHSLHKDPDRTEAQFLYEGIDERLRYRVFHEEQIGAPSELVNALGVSKPNEPEIFRRGTDGAYVLRVNEGGASRDIPFWSSHYNSPRPTAVESSIARAVSENRDVLFTARGDMHVGGAAVAGKALHLAGLALQPRNDYTDTKSLGESMRGIQAATIYGEGRYDIAFVPEKALLGSVKSYAQREVHSIARLNA